MGVSITAKDTATLTGGDAPSGTVTFGLYTNSGCTTAVTPAVGGTVTLSGGTASSSGSWTPAAVGTYYWQATYNGDSNNNSVSTCGGTSEQVKVSATTPTLGTVASPAAATVGVSITAKDTATLTGGDAPSGTVTFGLYTNSGCTTAVTPAVGGTVTLSGGTASSSGSWTPAAVGTYYWQATYNGDSNNNSVSTCGGTSEQVKVSATTPTLGTVASPAAATVGVSITAKDTATLTGGDAPSGTVTFGLYTNSGCTTAVTPAVGGTVTLSGGTASSSGSWTPAAVGTYYWQATYNGDSNNNSVSTCGGTSEQVKVSATTPTLGTVASPAAATVGVSITAKDTATLTGGDAPSGTVTFGLYTNSGCTTAVTPAVGGTVTLSGGTASSSGSWTPAAVGTYYWQATYNGDSNNNSVSTCGGTSEQVKVSATTPTLGTVASPAAATVGVSITVKDTATLTGGDAPSGTVTFRLYTNSGCTTAVTPASAGRDAERWNGELSAARWTPAAVGTYYWQAIYNGDGNNSTVSTCGGVQRADRHREGIAVNYHRRQPNLGDSRQGNKNPERHGHIVRGADSAHRDRDI